MSNIYWTKNQSQISEVRQNEGSEILILNKWGLITGEKVGEKKLIAPLILTPLC